MFPIFIYCLKWDTGTVPKDCAMCVPYLSPYLFRLLLLALLFLVNMNVQYHKTIERDLGSKSDVVRRFKWFVSCLSR